MPAPHSPDGGADLLHRTATQPKTERPKLYKVLLHNDEFTPFEVVLHVLQKVFHMTPEHAFAVMMTAHQTDVCLCGVFTLDIAETKVMEATDLARQFEAALRFTTEPEE